MIVSEEAVATLLEMVRQLVRDIRARRHVPAHRDLVSRAARCRYRRLPKRGFKNRNSKEIVGINVDALNRCEDGAVVTVETMIETGLVSNPRDGVKILGNGEVTKKLTVKANAFSESAKAKIEAAGGTVEVI